MRKNAPIAAPAEPSAMAVTFPADIAERSVRDIAAIRS
jgi:hypothetical protein